MMNKNGIEDGVVPVTLQFSNVYGNNPKALPGPGDASVCGVKAPYAADGGTKYMLSDGSVWEYKGVSAYKCDNESRINGWENQL